MRRWLICLGVSLLLVACAPTSTPTPFPTQPPQSYPPATSAFVVVTLPPVPTAEPTTTATPAFDVAPYVGSWQLDFRYQFEGGDPIDQVRFVGAGTIQIGADARAVGEGALTTFPFRENCFAATLNEDDIQIAIEGQVGLDVNGALVLIFSIRPEDPSRLELYSLQCPDSDEPLEWRQQMLWPTLNALHAQPYTVPLVPGIPIDVTQDVEGPTGGTVKGTLNTWIRLALGSSAPMGTDS